MRFYKSFYGLFDAQTSQILIFKENFIDHFNCYFINQNIYALCLLKDLDIEKVK